MGTYALINIETNIVENVFVWDGESEWSPPEGYKVVATEYAGIGWSYINGEFVEPVPPTLTPEEVLALQSAKLQLFTQLAAAQKRALTDRISTINDAIDLDMATPAEVAELAARTAQLKAWKTYAVLLGRVTAQVGWPPEVDWPVQPTGGMDLSVSLMSTVAPAS